MQPLTTLQSSMNGHLSYMQQLVCESVEEVFILNVKFQQHLKRIEQRKRLQQ